MDEVVVRRCLCYVKGGWRSQRNQTSGRLYALAIENE